MTMNSTQVTVHDDEQCSSKVTVHLNSTMNNTLGYCSFPVASIGQSI